MTTTITMTKRIGPQLLFPVLLLSAAMLQPVYARAISPEPAPVSAQDTSPYADGTRAMNEHRWKDAINAFDKVIDAKDKRAAAALYWKAYSLNKLQRYSDSAAICGTLRAQYRDSSWNKDCDVLLLSDRNRQMDFNFNFPAIDVHVDPIVIPPVDFKNNMDFKILSLNSMLKDDPAKAVSELRDILSGNEPMGTKKHALFVLAQNRSPETQAILHDVVMGKMGPELQRQAVMMMAIFQGRRENDALAELYRTTTDPEIKKSIISAFFITQDGPHMVELARSEKDLTLKRSIVSQLAIMHDKAANDYMTDLISK